MKNISEDLIGMSLTSENFNEFKESDAWIKYKDTKLSHILNGFSKFRIICMKNGAISFSCITRNENIEINKSFYNLDLLINFLIK